ncbi:MAG: DUF3999 domain-containing protein [Planctomycetota bacterium]|nr:DUF3999 domain-containing protein [Planctomycetota bacterium]
MKTLPSRTLIALLLSGISWAQEPAQNLTMEQMAFGIELTPSEPNGVQTLQLPKDVYRHCTSHELADVRVFNGAGEPVPHALKSMVEGAAPVFSSVLLPVFPVYGEPASSTGDLALELTRSSDGSVLAVRSGGANEPDQRLIAHLIDASQSSQPLNSIQVKWSGEEQDFLVGFSLEGSTDLATWETVVPRASFASMGRDGARLEQHQVEFAPCSLPYLRLRWTGKTPPKELVSAGGTSVRAGALPERHSIFLEGSASSDSPSLYLFPSAGPLSPVAVQVHLPQPDSLVRATVQHRESQADSWRTAKRAQFFRLNGEPEHTNAPHTIASTRSTHWSLLVDSTGGGLGSGVPVMELFYYPHKLAFLARGSGPYTLAFGKHGAPPSDFAWSDLEAMLAAQSDLPGPQVEAGAIGALAGPGVLLPPAPPSYKGKRAALWAVLIAGVAMLGYFSLKLLRQLPEAD